MESDLALCSMTHPPVSLWAVFGWFAAFLVLAGIAGRLRQWVHPHARSFGTVLLAVAMILAPLSSVFIQRWGLVADTQTCTPLGSAVTAGILVGLNLAVLAGWYIGARPNRSPSQRTV